MELQHLNEFEQAVAGGRGELVRFGVSFLFLVGVMFYVASQGAGEGSVVLVMAAIVATYMAMNIGANDVANNMGPAVGAGALSMGGAILIAAVFESAGALIAGGDVVSTISNGIVAPDALDNPASFIWAMMAALLASALWVNLATWIGAPVSTTHAVVGGVVGAGITAAGFGAVNWAQMGMIAASWVISPLLGGLVAVAVLWFVKERIIYRDDKIAAARVWVPVLVGLMAGTFATYLAMKGLKQVVDISLGGAALIGLGLGVVCWLVMIPVIRRQSEGLENRNKSLKVLFGVPLVVSAALLSFAHGANDVANAVGPLAAIVQATQGGAIAGDVAIPLWVMLIGAFGISFGLCLFGPKLIRMVGGQITKLNPMRAYCVALSAAVTVIIASWLGLPVSSTHIAVGAIFGVGFFREWDVERRLRRARMALPDEDEISPTERRRRKLVRRQHVLTIGAAWVITVPASAALAALLFLLLRQLPV